MFSIGDIIVEKPNSGNRYNVTSNKNNSVMEVIKVNHNDCIMVKVVKGDYLIGMEYDVESKFFMLKQPPSESESFWEGVNIWHTLKKEKL